VVYGASIVLENADKSLVETRDAAFEGTAVYMTGHFVPFINNIFTN